MTQAVLPSQDVWNISCAGGWSAGNFVGSVGNVAKYTYDLYNIRNPLIVSNDTINVRVPCIRIVSSLDILEDTAEHFVKQHPSVRATLFMLTCTFDGAHRDEELHDKLESTATATVSILRHGNLQP